MAPFKPAKQLVPPEEGSDFAFPFLPYDIQLDFMKSLYSVLQGGGIGIFESPTGTGKSLSLTCGTLTWLKDYTRTLREELSAKIDRLRSEIARLEKENELSSDWISGQYNAMGQRKELGELMLFRQSLEDYQEHLLQMKDKAALQKTRWVVPKDEPLRPERQLLQQDVTIDEDAFLIPEDSDESDEELGGPFNEEEERYRPVQAIFCSRTHSQLSQVVSEVKETQHATDLRLISLASRQSLCINEDVKKLKTTTLINERCLELLKKGGKTPAGRNDDGQRGKKRRKLTQSCPYFNQSAIENLKNGTLFEVPDIEDLVKAGKREKACPYYASRAAIPDAQLLMVPYQLILHRRTRQQSGIVLRDAILIIDEAHNLLDTLAAIHSQELRQEQLRQVRVQLSAYKARYLSRFSTKNLLRINQLIFIATRLAKLLSPDGKTGTNRPASRMLQTQELLLEGDIFNLNFVEILAFCERSRIAQKVHGFAQSAPPELFRQNVPPVRPKVGTSSKVATSALKSLLKNLEDDKKRKEQGMKKNSSSGGTSKQQAMEPPPQESNQENVSSRQEPSKQPAANVIRPLINFLECLVEDSGGDSRVLLSFNEKDDAQSCMKYLLLNPGARFENIIQSCRSVVLAGGTMQPTEELTEQIFRQHKQRLTIKSYPHVVPQDAVLPLALSRGPTGKEFRFNFANKQNTEMISELQSTLLNVCQVVPNGVVVFFSSYDALDQFYRHLEQSGNLARLEDRKKVFREPKTAGQVERTLLEYGRAARSAIGAILFSVVGGKLSEGLNFSDELGRCVVVVGLPYPNRTSPELIERMRFLDRTLTLGTAGTTAGDEYYENLCMKAVNQCIGRAVRHIRDYAAVLLLDTRYCTGARIRQKLPAWISERMDHLERYGQAHGKLVKFFRDHKSKREAHGAAP
uniref:DNA 5'-3' helicase n=1 Tax=Anopheles dirus TaxID=7168 RepID=A0A182NQF4_9DIPT